MQTLLVLAALTFVSPLPGSQAVGVQALEVTTDTTKVDRVDFYVDGALAGVARKPPYRIAYDFGTTLAPRTITAKVWSNAYKTSESASVITSAGDVLNIDLVEVPLRVRASRALKAGDLRVRENGVEQTIRDVKQERPAAHFAFIIDRSLSMGDGKLEAALRAVEGARKKLRAGDTMSVTYFNHIVSKSRPVTLVPSGGTSLRDAVASVASKQRTYAIVITDGGDRNSQLTEEDALRRISGTKTVVSAIVLGASHTKFLDRAASNTGGTVAEASKENVARELSRILDDINGRYLVAYQSQGTQRGWRTIEVKPRGGAIEIVSARKGYFAE
ncbi:MAG TPA: Ig-like domain-containing protein [Thermoanaerobaculia bacterium]|nr:Ig-like domain-containing protein [Thermoanaerobaculia bacterium]